MAIFFAAASQAQMITGMGEGTSNTSTAPTGYLKGSLRINEPEWYNPTNVNFEGSSPVVWFTISCYTNGSSWAGNTLLNFRNTDTGATFFRIASNSSENIVLSGHNGTGLSTLHTMIDAYGGFFRVDVKVDLSVTGGVEVYLNGTLVGSTSGDLSAYAANPANSFQLYGNNGFNSSFITYWSQIIVADEDTRGMLLQETRPTAEGLVFDDFVGDYSMLTANGPNVGGAVQGLTDGASQSYITEDLHANFSTGYEILAVVINSRSSATADSPLNVLSHIITDGINTLEGGDIVLDSVPQPRVSIFSTAPDGTPWDATKFNAAEFGLRSKLNV